MKIYIEFPEIFDYSHGSFIESELQLFHYGEHKVTADKSSENSLSWYSTNVISKAYAGELLQSNNYVELIKPKEKLGSRNSNTTRHTLLKKEFENFLNLLRDHLFS